MNDENVKLVVALRQLQAESSGRQMSEVRVTGKLFHAWKTSVSVMAQTSEKFWAVPKGNCPNAPTDSALKDALVTLSAWDEVPPCFDPETHWLVDQCVPREKLGLGVREVSFSVGVTKKSEKRKEPANPTLQPEEPAPSAKSQAARPASATPVDTASQMAPATKPPRVLTQQSSSEGDELELIATNCKSCFSQSLLWSEDQNIPTAEYWLRAFCGHAKLAAAKPADLPADMCIFPKFVASRFLEHGTVEVLPHFTSLLKDLKEKVPSIFPKPGLVEALIAMTDYDPGKAAEVDLSSLSLSARSALVASPLYNSWMKKNLEDRILRLQKLQKKPQDLRPLVEPLAKISPDDRRLTFALTWCGPSSYGEKLTYLMEDLSRFELLHFWYPDAEESFLQPFASSEPQFAKLSVKEYVTCLEKLSSSSSAAAHIKLSVLKGLVSDFGHLQSLAGEGPLRPWAKALFLEQSSAKLGLQLAGGYDQELQAFPVESMPEDSLGSLQKWFIPKLSAKAAFPCHKMLAERMAAWKSSQEKKPSKPEDLPEADPPKAAEAETGISKPSSEEWKEGDKVLCLPGKRKSDYNMKEGIIVKVLAKKLRLDFKTVGEVKDIDKERCQLSLPPTKQEEPKKEENEKEKEQKPEKPSLEDLLGKDIVD
eukprot:Skav209322  [mRNA]  locus=scaffold724:121652:123604:+ [translate_table: standard]